MIKGKILFPSIFMTLVFIFYPIVASGAPVIKIGFVDQQAVLEKSKMGQNIENQIKALQDSKQVKIDEMRKEIEDLDRKIKNKDLPIKELHREELKKEMRKKEIDLKYFVDEAYEEANQMSSKLLKKFDEKLRGIVKKVSEAEGYSIVVEKTGIIFYGNPEFELTDKVIMELNKITE